MLRRIINLLLVSVLVCSLVFCSITVYAEDEEYKEFLQGDPRWSSYVYGGGETIGSAGCAITSFAILMAYADPSLRDVTKFNPEICARDYLNFSGGCVYWEPKAGPLSLKQDFSFTAHSEEEAINGIKEALDKGYYCIMWGTPLYSSGSQSSTHYSPVVGWDDSAGKPILWDTFCGGNTWQEFVDGGISSNEIHVYESSNLKFDASMNTSSSDTELTDEQKLMVENTLSQWELHGMPKKSEIADLSLDLELAKNSDLSFEERVNLNGIKDDIELRNKSIHQVLSISVVVVGILLILYSILLLVGHTFDKANTFLNISLVSLLTLGKINVLEYEEITEDMSKEGYVTYKALVVRCIIMFIIGGLLVSGAIPILIMKIIYSL